jgi:hypothetical protein
VSVAVVLADARGGNFKSWGALGLFFVAMTHQCVSSQEQRGAHVAERYSTGSRQTASVILSQKSDCEQ